MTLMKDSVQMYGTEEIDLELPPLTEEEQRAIDLLAGFILDLYFAKIAKKEISDE